jgi:hypothetical protein
MNNDRMLTVADVAPIVGWTIKGCQNSLRLGKFPIRHTRLGREYRFTRADVDAYQLRGEISNPLLADRRRHFFASAKRKVS